jgi:hypothetical protein
MQSRMVSKLNARDIQRKVNSGEIKVVYARSSRRETLRPWVQKVLEAVGHPEAFVTDESMIGDFFFSEPKKIEEVAKKLGVRATARDRVVDVASRLRTGQIS